MSNRHEPVDDYLFVWHNGCFRKIDSREVVYLEASRNYCTIWLSNGTSLLLSVTLLKASEAFPPKRFIRISRSYVVNVDYIDTVSGNTLAAGNKEFTITPPYRDAIFGRFRFLGSNSRKLMPDGKPAAIGPDRREGESVSV